VSATASELIGWALDASLREYRQYVRRRMGLPDTEEAYRQVMTMPEARIKEYLSDHEIARYEEYKALRMMWDGGRPAMIATTDPQYT